MVQLGSEAGTATLSVKICELQAGRESWSAQIAVEARAGDLPLGGVPVALFYEGVRVGVETLDDWGYAIFNASRLQAPEDLTAKSSFTVRLQRPALSKSSAFRICAMKRTAGWRIASFDTSHRLAGTSLTAS